MKKFELQQVGEVLQKLYNSEINMSLSTFWDGGYDWKLGDHANGYTQKSNAREREPYLVQAVEELAFAAVEQYPESDFALWYNTLPFQTGQLAG